MPLTKPLNNNVLVEVLREDDGVSRVDENESMKYGTLIAYRISRYHITASAAIEFSDDFMEQKSAELMRAIGSTVRWEEYAEGGQTFKEDGKTYALIPWWRLIGFEEKSNVTE